MKLKNQAEKRRTGKGENSIEHYKLYYRYFVRNYTYCTFYKREKDQIAYYRIIFSLHNKRYC